jgi:hypothetical protein
MLMQIYIVTSEYVSQARRAALASEHLRCLPQLVQMYLKAGMREGRFTSMALTNLTTLDLLRHVPVPKWASPIMTNNPQLFPMTQTPYVFSPRTPAGLVLTMESSPSTSFMCRSHFWLWAPSQSEDPRPFFFTDGRVMLLHDNDVNWYYQTLMTDVMLEVHASQNAPKQERR